MTLEELRAVVLRLVESVGRLNDGNDKEFTRLNKRIEALEGLERLRP